MNVFEKFSVCVNCTNFWSEFFYLTIYIADLQDAAWLTDLLLKGQYQEVLKSNIVEWVFGKERERSPDKNFSQVIEDNVEKYMKDTVGTSRLIQWVDLFMMFGVCIWLEEWASSVKMVISQSNRSDWDLETNRNCHHLAWVWYFSITNSKRLRHDT